MMNNSLYQLSRLFGLVAWLPGVALLFMSDSQANAQQLDPTILTKFVDACPNPLTENKIQPSRIIDSEPWFDVRISQFTAQVHRDLPATTFWGYNRSVPGPLFEVQRGQMIHVNWINDLRDVQGAALDHLLPYDTTIHGAHPHIPRNRIVTHLHGGVTHELSDGFPFHWVTADPDAAANGMGGPAGNVYTTHYTNRQRANALWYHDHAMGITRLNVYAGMAGVYLIRDGEEAAADLPQGKYEVPLMIMDRSFNEDGSLYYPDGFDLVPEQFRTDNPQATGSVIPAFYGDVNLVNGKAWPYMNVEQRLYRLRLYNAANARVYDFVFEDESGNTVRVYQIGTDGGLLEAPVARDNLDMGPADRIDLLIDFSRFEAGEVITLKNVGPAGMAPNGPAADPATVGQVMQFRIIGPATDTTNNAIPTKLSTIERLADNIDESVNITTLPLTLSRTFDSYRRPELLTAGLKWVDPVIEIANLSEPQVWEFINQTNMAHPMHLHLEAFQVLERSNLFGDEIPLQAWERGYEDTFVVGPQERVKILVKFEQYAGDFVYHCHILEHEDYEMMRPMRIVDPMPGDLDRDGDVDDADYGLMFSNYTGPVGARASKSVLEGDLDGDGDVDGADLNAAFMNYTGPGG